MTTANSEGESYSLLFCPWAVKVVCDGLTGVTWPLRNETQRLRNSEENTQWGNRGRSISKSLRPFVLEF